MVLPVRNLGSGPYNRMVNPREERLMLPLGAVDRDKGVFRTQRGDTRDVRNVLLRDGTVHLRPGFSQVVVFKDENGDPVDVNVLGVTYMHFENALIAVVMDSDFFVRVYKVTSLGEDPVLLEVENQSYWFEWAEDLPTPVVTMATNYRMLFIAHDTDVLGPELENGVPVIGSRAPTIFYEQQTAVIRLLTSAGDPLFGVPENPLWARGTADPGETDITDHIRFRGVVSYLDYIVGWGFGTNTEPRPELARLSLPGQPSVFEEQHWVSAGARGEAITTCAPAGNGFMLFKANRTYPLLGTSPQTFAVGPAVDTKFGCVGANLWTNINGVLYVWSAEGPRATTGGPLEDLAIPLDLEGPAPDALMPSDEITRLGFATYVPKQRVVMFVFEDWAYVLDVRSGKPGGWSYWKFASPLASTGLWYIPTEGAMEITVPQGPEYHGEFLAGATTLALTVHNPVNTTGQEMIETYYRILGSAEDYVWASGAQVISNGPGSRQDNIRLANLFADTIYDLAFRYQLFGRYNPAYPGNKADPVTDPESWPAISRGTARTLAGQGISATWSRLAHPDAPPPHEQVHLVWEVPAGEDPSTLRYLEKYIGFNESPPNYNWVVVENAIPQGGMGLENGKPYWNYIVQDGEREEYIWFRIRPVGAPGGSTGMVWTGPASPATLTGGTKISDVWTEQFLPFPDVGTTGLAYGAEVLRDQNNLIYEIIRNMGAWAFPPEQDPNGPYGVRLEWEEFGMDGTPMGVIRDQLCVINVSTNHELPGLAGEILISGWTPEFGETGLIHPDRAYRVRACTALVYPAQFTIADYLANPLGKWVDYSPWTVWTEKYAVLQ